MDEAIQVFKMYLPDWWFTVGTCKLSRHARCGPYREGLDANLLNNRVFTDGFHCDHDGTMADALKDVVEQALNAKHQSI